MEPDKVFTHKFVVTAYESSADAAKNMNGHVMSESIGLANLAERDRQISNEFLSSIIKKLKQFAKIEKYDSEAYTDEVAKKLLHA